METTTSPNPWETSEYIASLTIGQQMAIKAMNWIEDNPKHWDQKNWHCGTTHCYAGIVEILTRGGDPAITTGNEDHQNTSMIAAQILGLDHDLADNAWFYSKTSLEELRALVRAYTCPIDIAQTILEEQEQKQRQNETNSDVKTIRGIDINVILTIYARPDINDFPQDLQDFCKSQKLYQDFDDDELLESYGVIKD